MSPDRQWLRWMSRKEDGTMASTETSRKQVSRQRDDGTHSDSTRTGQLRPADDFVDYLTSYARQKPEVAALWCFGVGFVLGWKLKPW